MTFESLELPKPLLEVLREAGVVTAFPIQAATIPDALMGRDVLGRGRTGSGKTLAFGLPTLTRLEGLRAKPRRPLGLILVPTRELAMQVEDALRPYARALRLRIRSVYGGAPMRRQIDALRYGVELLVATPGRLSDLIERGECELDDVDVAILDEADQMCDMGFLPHVSELMDQVAPGGQRLLFSATLDGAVDEIVKKYMADPVLHEVDPQAGVVTTMSHHLLMVAPQHKAKVAAQIAGRHSGGEGGPAARSLFFVRTQMAVDRVTEQLRERGLAVAGLHGGMTQIARTKTLEDFKEGRTPVLVATDVAARGIHVDGIDLVVHVDPPRDSKDYLHRAGRTARAGQSGVVASLVLPKQRKQAQRLMDAAGVTAQELDAAPVGTGGRWQAAGAALAELTGAREVPEPGDVAVFTLPVRERDRGSRFGERRGYGRPERRDERTDYRRDDRNGQRRDGHDGRDRSYGSDRFGRDRDRDGQRGGHSGSYDRDRGGYQRRDGDRFARDDRRSGPERRTFGNADRSGSGSRPEGGVDRRSGGERFGRDERGPRTEASPRPGREH
ncbi:MAG TPA: DEAD/DEAH box helicase [Actinocrinis sp.]